MNSIAWKRRTRAGAILMLGVLLAGCVGLSRRTAFDDYIHNHDPAYKWDVVSTIDGEGYTGYVINLTSQKWLTEDKVDRTEWKHWLLIARPDEIKYNKAFLYIGGGNNRDEAPRDVSDLVKSMATASGSVVAELRMVPNQPLTFVVTDNKPRYEDDLIAYAWDRFLRTGDPEWLPRFPMAKSAVRAMDTMTELMASEEGGGVNLDGFVVAGGSKRGWTTWMTAVADERVVAIAPIVIDLLNLEESMAHHHDAYGFWAPAVGDYVHHGIVNWFGTKQNAALLKLVDPFSYRNRLRLPKYIVNAAGDQFFLPDSSQFYFDELKGEKHLRYVPNGDHGLGGTDAREGILTFYQTVLDGRERPEYEWRIRPDGSIWVRVKDQPIEVNLWQATNAEARDFRVETIGRAYTRSRLESRGRGVYIAEVEAPEEGWTAFFIELVYDVGAGAPFKVTTGVSVVPDILPFAEGAD